MSDPKRYNQLVKGDILLQINGKNVDTISEKDLNKFVINSNNPKAPVEFRIESLTIYRPFVEDQLGIADTNLDDDDSSSQQDNEQHDESVSNVSKSDCNENGHNIETTTNSNNSNSANSTQQNGIKNNSEHIVVHNTENNGTPPQTPKAINNCPMNSSTPLKNGDGAAKGKFKFKQNAQKLFPSKRKIKISKNIFYY